MALPFQKYRFHHPKTAIREQFPNESTCRKFFENIRWPPWRICSHCGHDKSWVIQAAANRRRELEKLDGIFIILNELGRKNYRKRIKFPQPNQTGLITCLHRIFGISLKLLHISFS
jgi:hypothetical protein